MRETFCLIAAALLVISATTPSVFAGGSIGTEVTSSAKFSSVGVNGQIDLIPKWSASVAVSQDESKIDYNASTRQINAKTAYSISDAHGARVGFTYWTDVTNGLDLVGPTMGYTYVLNSYDEDGEKVAGDPEILSVYIDNDIFFYGATLPGRRVSRPNSPGIPPFHLTQFHPYLEIDKPLIGGSLLLYGAGGYYFYSDDPQRVDQIVGNDALLSASGARWLVGGLVRSNWSFGVVTHPFSSTAFRLDLGGYKSAINSASSNFFGGSVEQTLFSQFKAKVGYSHSRTFSGEGLNFLTGGLTYLF